MDDFNPDWVIQESIEKMVIEYPYHTDIEYFLKFEEFIGGWKEQVYKITIKRWEDEYNKQRSDDTSERDKKDS